jgi:hypothetical protein
VGLSTVLEGLQKVHAFVADLSAFGPFDLDGWAGATADGDLGAFALALSERLKVAAERIEELVPWSLYLARRREAQELGQVSQAALGVRSDRVRRDRAALTFVSRERIAVNK